MIHTNKEGKEYEDSHSYGEPHRNRYGAGPRPGMGMDWQDLVEDQLRMAGRMVDDAMHFAKDQVGDAVQYARDQVEDAVRDADVSGSLEMAMQRLKEQLSGWSGGSTSNPTRKEETARRRTIHRISRDLRSTYTKRTLLGWVCSIFGGTFTVAFLTVMLAEGVIALLLPLQFLACFMLVLGVKNLYFSRFLRELMRYTEDRLEILLEELAAAMQMPLPKLNKRLLGYTRSGWLSAWLSPEEGKLYLDLESWREARASMHTQPPQSEPAPDTEAEPQPDHAQRDILQQLADFADVLHAQRGMMEEDPQAVQELEEMERTSRAMRDWAGKHPDCLPKLRRMAEQYIPITMKLLYTYNDLKIHHSDNAQHVRKDIAGMLHALNLGFAALQDKLLDDVAMDVTGDIAALQGMLAWDGLAEEPMFEEKPRS